MPSEGTEALLTASLWVVLALDGVLVLVAVWMTSMRSRTELNLQRPVGYWGWVVLTVIAGVVTGALIAAVSTFPGREDVARWIILANCALVVLLSAAVVVTAWLDRRNGEQDS